MQAAQAIEGGHLVALGEGGVVEDGVDEVVHRAAQGHHRLADVDQLAGALADNVHAQHLAGVAMEDELEPAGGIAANLAARHLAIVGHAHFVGNVLVGQLLFGLADEADLGNGVDAVGIEAGVGGGGVVVEGARGGDASLLHRDRGQRGKADHVADGEDVLDLGLVVLVDGDAAAVVGLQAGGGQVQVVDVALAAHGVEQRVAGDLLVALQVGHHGARRQLFHALHLFAQAQGHAGVAQVVAERLDDLLVGKLQQPVALFDQRDAHAEDGEHAGVFDADDAAADHDQRARQGLQAENLVAVDDGAAVDGHLGRGGRLGADGDDDAVGLQRGLGLRAFHVHLVRIDEAGNAMDHVDAVARELRLGHVHFGLDHRLDAEGQVGHGDLFLHPVVDAVDRAVVVAGEVQHRLAHGLGGDGAGVDADAADHRAGLHNGHPLVHLGCGHGGSLPGGPGANDDQVILDGAHASVSPQRFVFRSRPR